MAQSSVFESFSEELRRVMSEAKMHHPTPPQEEAIPRLMRGENALIFAPTGSGKTEAALLPIMNNFLKKRPEEGISIIYVTPMRALNRDLLLRLAFWGKSLKFRVEVRHGDTPQSQRRRQSVEPPDLLVTTPETLQALIPSRRMRGHLRSVRFLIVDEVHAIVESKRGAQLSVGLERLRRVVNGNIQIVGLSATVGSPQEVAKFLVGKDGNISIIDSRAEKRTRYFIENPEPSEDDHLLAQTLFSTPDAASRISRMMEMIDEHSSTLIFVNSRTVAEMLGSKLNLVRKDVAVHHGSLPREERERIETEFKEGRIGAMVCTSTLELGIDIGSVDLAIQYMSPRQVSTLIQRVGRSGHSLGRDSEGLIISVSPDDMLESSAAIEMASRGELEPLRIRRNSLDVLSHQLAGLVLDFDGKMSVEEAFTLIRNAYPFESLSQDDFRDVIEYIEHLGILKTRDGLLGYGWRTREYYFENLSMIPDEKRYPVIDLLTQQKVGILGEEFVLLKAKVGVNFICRGKVWKIENISEDSKVYVTPVEDPLAAIPGWDGELLPVPMRLARKTGGLRRLVSDMLEKHSSEEVVSMLKEIIPAEKNARRMVVDEIREHRESGAAVPDDMSILIEGFDRYLIVHSCFGEAINRTLAFTFEEILSSEGLLRFWWADGYRILFELTMQTEHLDLEGLGRRLFSLDEQEIRKIFFHRIEKQFPFPERLRNIGQRFGIFKRGQYIGHPNLCSLGSKFVNTPVYEEGLNEIFTDLIDLPGSSSLVAMVRSGEVAMNFFSARERPTPIGYHILYRHVEIPELIAPDAIERNNIARMKMALENRSIDLVCFDCGSSMRRIMVKDLGERPSCTNCRSALLALSPWSSESLRIIVQKKLARQALGQDEIDILSKARRSADLILSYGKNGLLALSVYGIGPQTASRILAKMHDDQESFFRDLMEAKLKFITTRPYWDNG